MKQKSIDSYSTKQQLVVGGEHYHYYSLPVLAGRLKLNLENFPFSIRILLENMLRNEDGKLVLKEDIEKVAGYNPLSPEVAEIPFMPGRVVLQDFTGVPAVVDLAAMRDAMKELGGDPSRINPIVRSDLVIDHSVQVDFFGSEEAYRKNVEKEFQRNKERYTVLKWAQKSFKNFNVVPPGTGIVHQVNLEYLAEVILQKTVNGEVVAYPDTLVGTDSHTTMINGISVLGWGVGGIEAEAVMLGQPYYMLLPEVVGVKLTGALPDGATATDLVLTIVEMLRKHGVVGKFVEFFGPGLSQLSLPDRATIANMAPEYGATMGYFPIDDITLEYLRQTARAESTVKLVEAYAKAQGIFRTDETPDPQYKSVLHLDMETVKPSLAGPKRPQDRIVLSEMKPKFKDALPTHFDRKPEDVHRLKVDIDGKTVEMQDGSIVIAAITSCTNTSNPAVMLAAGLVAQKALEKGLTTKPWVKTSLAPGSRVVTEYLKKAGLLEALNRQRFNLVGYGCTTCIGNSGPLPQPVEQAIKDGNLIAAAVLSGNRNFEGRIHAQVKANYLASPPLVVAYALAGRVDLDLQNEPLGTDKDGNPVFLKDIWPSRKEIEAALANAITPELYQAKYAEVFDGDTNWQSLDVKEQQLYDWDPDSTYIKSPPFFKNLSIEPAPIGNIENARVLALLGDSTTTDHISPAGAIPEASPAGQYLKAHGLSVRDFNSFGSRRGNHEVMMRGTFGNIRIRNHILNNVEGGFTEYFPTGEQMYIYDAAIKYQAENTPLIVIAGKEYGTGSSRDWAAKGTLLLGVKAVIAESFERIHRSNLIGMGVLPLQFAPGDNWIKLGLTGREIYSISGIDDSLKPGQELNVTAVKEDGVKMVFNVICRLDSPIEIEYYKNGGILQTVLRQMVKE